MSTPPRHGSASSSAGDQPRSRTSSNNNKSSTKSTLVYKEQRIIDDLPLLITAIASCEEKLILGTSDGSLLLYIIPPPTFTVAKSTHQPSRNPTTTTSDEVSHEFEANFLYSEKGVTGPGCKSIDQLALFQDIVLLVSDGYLCLHRLVDFTLIQRVNESKGIISFAIRPPPPAAISSAVLGGKFPSSPLTRKSDSPSATSEGGTEELGYLCIALRRALLIYSIHPKTGQLVHWKDIRIPEAPAQLIWLDSNRIAISCVTSSGTTGGYFTVYIPSGGIIPLVPLDMAFSACAKKSFTSLLVGAGMERLCITDGPPPGQSNVVYLSKEENVCLHSLQNLEERVTSPLSSTSSSTSLAPEPSPLTSAKSASLLSLSADQKKLWRWSHAAQSIVYTHPYLVGLLSLPSSATFGSSTSSHPSNVEVLSGRTGRFVQSLYLPGAKIIHREGRFLFVASGRSVWTLIPIDFDDQLDMLLARNEFSAAMAVIEEREFSVVEDRIASVIHVQGLYAQHMFLVQHNYADALAILEEIKASPIQVIGLIPELFESSSDADGDLMMSSGLDSKALDAMTLYLGQQRAIMQRSIVANVDSQPSDEVFETARAIDNALFKIYIYNSSPLLGPLLRVSNHCNLEYCELVLMSKGKMRELVDLYNGKKLYVKAVELYKKALEWSELSAYLKRLDMREYMPLILETAAWMSKSNLDLAVSSITEHYGMGLSDPKMRQDILTFLAQVSPEMELAILEHIVMSETTQAELHDALVIKYLNLLLTDVDHISLAKQSFLDESDLTQTYRGVLPSFWQTRRKLFSFLAKSSLYSVKDALFLFVEHLATTGTKDGDSFLDERCLLLAKLDRHKEALMLMKEHGRPKGSLFAYCQNHYQPGSDVYIELLKILVGEEGFAVHFDVGAFLADHFDKLDAKKVLELFKSNDSIIVNSEVLLDFLCKKNRAHNFEVFELKMIKDLLMSEILKKRILLRQHQSQRVEIDDYRMCSVCLKRISMSAFALLPNGSLVHAMCIDKAMARQNQK